MELEQESPAALNAPAKPAERRRKVIRPPSLTPSILAAGLRELYWYRDLLATLTVHRIKVRYKQSALGLGWALLQPLALMLVYTVIFSYFTRVPTEGVVYPLFVLSGILPWTCFQTALSSSAMGLVSHSNLITKVYFPREILPLTYVFAAFFDFAVACVILVAMMLWYRVAWTPRLFFVIPILLVLLVLASGFSMLISAVQVQFRDIGLAMPLLLQLWMFGTPVVYPFSDVPQRFRVFFEWNPLVGVIENFRRVVIQGAEPNLYLLAISAGVGVALQVFAYLFFKYKEATMADVI